MEVLSQILKKTEDSGLLRGFQVGPVNSIGVRISHLLFADDTICSVMLLEISCCPLDWLCLASKLLLV